VSDTNQQINSCYNLRPLNLDDARKLYADFGILASGLVELGAIARVADPWKEPTPPKSSPEIVEGVKILAASLPPPTEQRPIWAPMYGFPFNRDIVSLARMVNIYTRRHLVKDSPDTRVSDWSAVLTQKQIECASGTFTSYQ
jgi:hypothetical protein